VRRVLALLVLLATGLTACGREGGSDYRADVVVSFPTVGEAVHRIGAERVDIVDVTPPGAEPHDVELSSRDLDAIERADLVVYLGGSFQPAVAEAARRAQRSVDLLRPEEHDDPHIWLDPKRWQEAAADIEEALAGADPEGRSPYGRRGAALRADLERLHAQYEAGLRRCQRRVIVTAHRAFGPLTRRYGLEEEAITGVSPESEPDPRRLAELIDLVRGRGVTIVFTEPLLPSDTAEALARDAGVTTAVLDPLEGGAADGYLAAMGRNLAALRTALGCA
jgi:zinc transport system substrate-binding protein